MLIDRRTIERIVDKQAQENNMSTDDRACRLIKSVLYSLLNSDEFKTEIKKEFSRLTTNG